MFSVIEAMSSHLSKKKKKRESCDFEFLVYKICSKFKKNVNVHIIQNLTVKEKECGKKKCSKICRKKKRKRITNQI